MAVRTTKTRKKIKERLGEEEHLKIVQRYITSDLTNAQIGAEFNTTKENVDKVISRHWKSLTNIRESKNLIENQNSHNNHKNSNYVVLKQIGRVPSINTKFLELLSEPEDRILTDNELQYAYHYVATGDNAEAVESAKLNIGLMYNSNEKNRNQYKIALKIRGHYLRSKPNVAKYIQELKEKYYLPEIVDKNFIQRELLEQLHQLKESENDSAVRSQKLKTIELLGKSVGAFSDVLKVEEIDPAKALDYIESLASADDDIITDTIGLLVEEEQ